MMFSTLLFVVSVQVVSLPDGSQYEGETSNQLLHGQGQLTWPNGKVYVGQFANGLMNGTGELTHINGQVYVGDFVNGVPHGQGELTLANGQQYSGGFESGLYHGFGRLTIDEQSFYEGEFLEGLYFGQGTLKTDYYQYKGLFENNKFNGQGVLIDQYQSTYEGVFVDGAIQGQGQLTDSLGNIWQGEFVDMSLTGEGTYKGINGDHYQGAFDYNQYEGFGRLEYANGDVYEGAFSYGMRHGQGDFTVKDGVSATNTWEYDQIAPSEQSKRQQLLEKEAAFYNQPALIKQQIEGVIAGDDQQIELYGLTVAASAEQTVFASEIKNINQTLLDQGVNDNQLLSLVNGDSTLPWASHYSIQQSINGIAKKMNTEQDILLLYLTSHGGKDMGASIDMGFYSSAMFRPQDLNDMLDVADIKWRIIIISACYSGNFVEELADEQTLVVSAASATQPSFGCSNENEMTYFGEAYFKESLVSLDFIQAFHKAKAFVKHKEEQMGFEFSNPQMTFGQDIKNQLKLFKINQ